MQVLATDLDGTLIPLEENQQNVSDLKTLSDAISDAAIELVYVTGRHLQSVVSAIEQHALPIPDWLICDVGATVLERVETLQFRKLDSYHADLQAKVEGYPQERLRALLNRVSGIRLQEPEKQGRFKLSYYCSQLDCQHISQDIESRLKGDHAPYSLIASLDPVHGLGLLDLLPVGVSKAYALQWWSTFRGLIQHDVVFAGDSGNDTAALTAGYRSILVGNAHESVVSEVNRMSHERGFANRLCLAKSSATSGVLEGCRHHGLF